MQILLADDHGLFRDSMGLWLKQLSPSVDIVNVNSYASLVAALKNNRPFDLVLTDLDMPGMQGTESINDICGLAEDVPVIVISANHDPVAIAACLTSGARGFVPKSSSGKETLAAIQQVLAGSVHRPKIPRNHTPLVLTAKQRKLLRCLAQGLSNREISQTLGLTEGTVKQYVRGMLDKLAADNRHQAMLRAREILGQASS